jgi:hypothetical protein
MAGAQNDHHIDAIFERQMEMWRREQEMAIMKGFLARESAMEEQRARPAPKCAKHADNWQHKQNAKTRQKKEHHGGGRRQKEKR